MLSLFEKGGKQKLMINKLNQVIDYIEKYLADKTVVKDAVFPNTGPFPETLQDTWAKTYAEWLVSSDYELVAAPNFSFTKMDENKDNYAYSEIWLPVRKITK